MLSQRISTYTSTYIIMLGITNSSSLGGGVGRGGERCIIYFPTTNR